MDLVFSIIKIMTAIKLKKNYFIEIAFIMFFLYKYSLKYYVANLCVKYNFESITFDISASKSYFNDSKIL